MTLQKTTKAILFSVLFFLSGCSSHQLWVEDQNVIGADDRHAVITFIKGAQARTSKYLLVWEDGDEFVGMITSGMYIKRKVTAGEHVFVGLSGIKNTTVLKANVEAGKNYIVRIQFIPFAGVRFDPYSSDEYIDPEIIEGWEKDYKQAAPGPGTERHRIKWADKAKLVYSQVQEGVIENTSVLMPEDHIKNRKK
jgi:hypothetical protein